MDDGNCLHDFDRRSFGRGRSGSHFLGDGAHSSVCAVLDFGSMVANGDLNARFPLWVNRDALARLGRGPVYP